MSTAESIHIRRMDAGDHPVFAALFHAATGGNFRAECFRRKYAEGDRIKFLGHLAFNQAGDAVAALGAMPQWIENHGTRLLAAQAVDAVTLPTYRRQGLFRRLVRANEELARSEGVDLFFGMAENDRGSAVGLRDLGWEPRGTMQQTQWLTGLPLQRRVMRKLFPACHAARAQRTLDAAAVALERSEDFPLGPSLHAGSGAWHSVHDHDFVRSRLPMGSQLLHVQAGHAWVVVRGREMRIGDLFGADHIAVLRDTIALARRAGLDNVMLRMNDGRTLGHLHQSVPGRIHGTRSEVLLRPLSPAAQAIKGPVLFTGGDPDVF